MATQLRSSGRRRLQLGSTSALTASICASVLLVAISGRAGDGPTSSTAHPNDPMFSEQWYLYPPGDEHGAPGSLNAVEAWGHIRPAKPVAVALLDGGVNYKHPDLAANIWKNEREKPNGEDDDGNGYVDDLWGWDFAYEKNDPTSHPVPSIPDQHDHGTALAGLMAAVPDNGIGIVGVGRHVRVMNLRVAGSPEFEVREPVDLQTAFARAVRYAVRNGARVIACAFGQFERPTPDVEAALKEAERAGVLFLKSAGNAGRNIDDIPDYSWLASYSNVLFVGGTTRDGSLAPILNFGRRVGVVVPSSELVYPSFDGYAKFEGPRSSFSVAIVAGVAATLLSQEPGLTPPQVIARLKEASVVEPGMEAKIGGGRLDMAKLFRP
ncbi:S8 family serine peptidase [Planctomyces sp. SH-PL62]|uniref:S8 family serine peptidase n=1 Tax=Planctomyces sp. SH-PL62 TaxID=1636152 RepID=UPI00078D23E3|nr:S8 family serine peptidase [Planctomyces sp. SH-PL62]AMV37473.1 Thermophilic serine proteinase precursor [Planctomyces sp. SH-PL62]